MMSSHPTPNDSVGTTDQVDQAAYPFTSRWLELQPGKMHYVDDGTGEPLVFVHGTPTWSFEWRNLIRAFAPTHRCIASDYIGFGLSERPRNFSYTPEAHAENLATFIERLGLDPFTLIVHDYGGPIGLPFCIRHPEQVKRLVLLNIWMWSFAGDRDMESKARITGSRLGRVLYGWSNLSLRVIMPAAYGDRSKLTPHIHRRYLERFPDRWSRQRVLWPLAKAPLASGRYYDSLWQQREKLRGRPALIIRGLKDSAFKSHQLSRWRELLPSARVLELEKAGHWPHEEAPDRVIEEMKDFCLTTLTPLLETPLKNQLHWTTRAHYKDDFHWCSKYIRLMKEVYR